ncbi:MAG: hypothetical protein IIB53_16590 [Planctomycetes bacterium]|nr:hypothetical protein [Planctomycetota bacterium]
MSGTNRLGIKGAIASLIAAGALCTGGLGQGIPACDEPDPKAGDCFTPTPGIPGCQDAECCKIVCNLDIACCLFEWDAQCVNIALANCPGAVCDTCGGFACLDCFDGHALGNPFCNDECTGQDCPGCCEAVCALDPFCCETNWDQICADEAPAICGCSEDDAPDNDDCANAFPVFLGETPFSTLCASTDGPRHEICDQDPFFPDPDVPLDVWFDYTADFTGAVRISTCDTADYNVKMAVYDGCACPVTEADLIECNDNGPNCIDGTGSEIILAVQQGACYKIRVGGYIAASGVGTLIIEPTGPPTNDDCANATVLNVNDSLTFSTVLATTDGLPSAACNFNGLTDIGNDVWYRFTVPEDSSYIVSLCDSSFDTKVAIYEDCGVCPPTNDPIACNDDFCDVQSQVVFDGTANQCFLIRIGNPAAPPAAGSGGSGRVILSRLLPAPDNIIYDNGAPDGTSGLSNGVADRELADDFNLDPCPDGWSVTGARMSGTWAGGGAFGLVTGFRIRVYDDAGGIPADTPNVDFTTTSFVEALTGNVFFGDPEILFDIEFPNISLDAELTQWISIQPLEVGDNLFQLTSAAGAGNINKGEVHVRYPDLGFPDWTPGSDPNIFGELYDVTFLLLGNDCGVLPCPADLVVDGVVGVKDLLFLLGTWGPCPKKGDCPADLVVDGVVGVKDLLFLLGAWGPCP